MASKRVTRSSTRAARATAANPPIAPPNVPAPAPVAVFFAVPQAGGANGASPRRTRSGKILGIVRSMATKLTRPRRAPRKAILIQEAAREVAETIDVVPTTNLATVPQPPAPPRKRGGKAVKKDDNEVQIVANDAAASSSNSEPAPAPIPAHSECTIERTKSTRSLASKDKGKAREISIEDDHASQPTIDPVPVPEALPAAPIPSISPKTVEDIERVTQKLRILNATELANDKIQLQDLKWESCVHDNTNLKYQNIPKAAALLYRERRAQLRQPARGMPAPPTRTTTPRGGAPVQQRPQPQPPAASTSRGAGPSNGGAGSSPLKREGGVNWGLPEYYKERIRKAKEEGRSLDPLALDHPSPGELPVASTSASSTAPSTSTVVPTASSTVPSASATVPVAPSAVPSASSTVPPVSSAVPSASSTVPSVSITTPPASAIVPPASSAVPPVASTTPLASTTVPTPSTSRPPTANGAAPSGNGNATAVIASDEPRSPRPIQRWNAVIFGYPEGHTPRNPWPASMIDPTGISTHPDAVQDASGAWVLPHRLSASVTRPATTTAAPQTPATVPVPPTPAPVSRSPPVSTSSNESADLAEVEASISIDVEDGDPHPAADLLPAAAPAASSSNAPPVAAAPRSSNVTHQRASSSNERSRELPRQPERDDDEAVIQQIVAEAVREFEEERGARPPQQPASRDRSQSTRAMGPPATPRPAASSSRSPGPIKWSEVKPFGSSFGLAAATKTAELASRGPAINWPENKPGGSSGMSIFGLPTNGKGKGKAPANTASIFDPAAAKGKGRAAAPTTIFGPPAVKGTAQKENGRPSTSIFGTPSDSKGKKRAREHEPQPESERRTGPAVPLYGYVSSTGPMKVRVSLVPVVPSPKRQRVSEAGGDTTDAVAAEAVVPAAEDVPGESAPALFEDQALQASTQNTRDGAPKRSRTEFEEGSSRGDGDDQDEDEDETRPAKKPRTNSQ